MSHGLCDRNLQVLITATFSLLLAGCSTTSMRLAGTDAESLGRQYAGLTTEREKVHFCFLLMEEGILASKKPIVFFRKVFRDDFVDFGSHQNGNKEAWVYLVDDRLRETREAQWPPVWQLTIAYSRITGHVVRCYIECPPEGK
jgi:hypothetical protein